MTSRAKNDTDYDYLFKILIIGDSGVGKTTILHRFAEDYFSNEYVATIGVDFQIKTLDIDSKRCKIQIWDTAGQDRFKCVVGAFYRNANGVIICFDLTDIQSFRNSTHWYDEVLRYCPDDIQVFLVGTKSDLKTRRVVSSEMIREFTEKYQIIYTETSSKTNENVDKCFIDFTRKLLEHANSLSIKPDENEQWKINITNRTKPIRPPDSNKCFGDDKCTI